MSEFIYRPLTSVLAYLCSFTRTSSFGALFSEERQTVDSTWSRALSDASRRWDTRYLSKAPEPPDLLSLVLNLGDHTAG